MKRKKATDIPDNVRGIVKQRDNWTCIFCHHFGESGYDANQLMHYIPRSQGGLGIEENLALGCPAHHQILDNGADNQKYKDYFREYLQGIYPEWNEKELKFNKWKGFAIS